MVLVNIVHHCFVHHTFHLLQVFLEAGSRSNQVCDVAAIESIVENIRQHLLQKRKQGIFHLLEQWAIFKSSLLEMIISHQVPNVVTEEVEEIVDRFSEVSASKQIVQMSLDGGEVCAEHHLGDLHIALRVDDDGRLGVDVKVVNLQPNVSVTIEGEDG